MKPKKVKTNIKKKPRIKDGVVPYAISQANYTLKGWFTDDQMTEKEKQ